MLKTGWILINTDTADVSNAHIRQTDQGYSQCSRTCILRFFQIKKTRLFTSFEMTHQNVVKSHKKVQSLLNVY